MLVIEDNFNGSNKISIENLPVFFIEKLVKPSFGLGDFENGFCLMVDKIYSWIGMLPRNSLFKSVILLGKRFSISLWNVGLEDFLKLVYFLKMVKEHTLNVGGVTYPLIWVIFQTIDVILLLFMEENIWKNLAFKVGSCEPLQPRFLVQQNF